MCILMLFNENTTLTLDAIRNATNITENELRRHLLSLCTPRLKVLKKASKVKGIVDDDSFTFNSEFTSKFKRIKIPLIIEHAGNAATMAAAGYSTSPHHNTLQHLYKRCLSDMLPTTYCLL
jgi:Cullin family